MSRLRIGLNLLWLVPGAVGGTEEATTTLLRAVRSLDPPDVELELFARSSLIAAHPDLAGIATRSLPLGGRHRAMRVAAESTWLARRTRGLDLVHHVGGTLPPLRSAPSILTIHDIQPLVRDETHGAVKRAYLRLAIPRSARAARLVVVPSAFVRDTLAEVLDIDPAKVVVVPHPRADRVAPTPPVELDRRYALSGEIVLYPVVTYPHKNHLVLLEAFQRVVRRRRDALLVLPGGVGGAERQVMTTIAELGLSDRVRRLGRVSDADLSGLYEMASVVAFPSRYEGFGLPAAEALARGVPVLASNVTALAEIVGDAGALVDPDDVEGWAEGIVAVLEDPAGHRDLVDRGLDRAQRWDPGNVASALVDVYHRAAAG